MLAVAALMVAVPVAAVLVSASHPLAGVGGAAQHARASVEQVVSRGAYTEYLLASPAAKRSGREVLAWLAGRVEDAWEDEWHHDDASDPHVIRHLAHPPICREHTYLLKSEAYVSTQRGISSIIPKPQISPLVLAE